MISLSKGFCTLLPLFRPHLPSSLPEHLLNNKATVSSTPNNSQDNFFFYLFCIVWLFDEHPCCVWVGVVVSVYHQPASPFIGQNLRLCVFTSDIYISTDPWPQSLYVTNLMYTYKEVNQFRSFLINITTDILHPIHAHTSWDMNKNSIVWGGRHVVVMRKDKDILFYIFNVFGIT